MHLVKAQIALLLWPLLACNPPPADPPVIHATTHNDSTEPPRLRCGSGDRDLPPRLDSLFYDSGESSSDLSQQSWSVDGTALATATINESVRFDLNRPARIYGFSVQWSNLPSADDPEREIFAGLYPDFGHNGFGGGDFPGAGTVTFGGPFEVDQKLWLLEDGGVITGWTPPW